MVPIQKHLSKLGLRATDKVTGFKGAITSVCFDLFGCVQVILNPGMGQDGKPQESLWFDISRLDITDPEPVMAVPNFEYGHQAEGLQGAADKPKSNRF